MPTAVAAIGTPGSSPTSRCGRRRGRLRRRALTRAGSVARALAAAGAWTLAEWLRGYVLHRLSAGSRVGYARLPGSPLAGYAPDRRRVSGVARRRAGRGAAGARRTMRSRSGAWRRVGALAAAAVALGVGRRSRWQRRVDGARRRAVAVSLVQGNVPQDAEVRSGFPRADVRAVRRARGSEPRPADRAAGKRVPDVPRRGAGQRDPRARAHGARDARGDLLLGLFTLEAPLPGSDRRRATTTACVSLGTSRTAALSQAPSRAVRRDDPAQGHVRLVHPQRAGDPARRPDARRRAAAAVRGRRHSASPSTSATRTPSAPSSSTPRARRRRCSSTSPTTRGTAARSPRSSTTRSPRCAHSSSAGRCCAPPTPASRRRSPTTAS